MRRSLTILALAAAFAIALPAAAQQQAADALNERAKAAMMSEPPQALALATQAEQRAATIGDVTARNRTAATALWLQSEALIRSRDAKAAAPRITRALRLIGGASGPSKLRGDLLLARAGVQQSQARPAEALASLQEAFRIFGEVNEKRSQSIALQTMAMLYTDAIDLASADKYLKQAAEIYEGDPQLLLFLYNNRGNVLLQMERATEATAQYRRALNVARTLGSETVLPPILANLARSLMVENKLDEADTVISEGLAIIRRSGKGSEARLLTLAADSAYRHRDLPRARALIERSFVGVNLAETPIAFRDAHLTAYNIYKALGDDARALPHLERVRKLGDDTAKLATTTSTALMAARFDYANQELRIANLKAEELRKAAEFQRTIFLGLGGATLVIIVLLSIGLFTIRRSRNQVRAANTELNQTNVALEKALKAKTEFLATTSHEIRTPLNGILGMTQIMLRDPAVPAATRDRLGIVHGAGMTMRALVDDILDVAKMETGNLTVELAATDLHATLRDVTRMWDEQARAKNVGFKLDFADAPRWIETDSGRLRQMLFNLLSNAVKFTEAGEIGVRAVAEGERLRLAVSDSGIGIPADKHEEIFESFKQADSGTTRKFGGTGLGLAIVRNLAHALEGEVAVASVEGQGTTFTVDLPLKLVEAPAGSDAETQGGETIVVLDKNPIARGMLRTMFTPKFAAVEFAATPDEAIDRVPDDQPTLLLADEATLKSAGEDAVAVLAALVERAKQKGARTAVLWAKPDEEMIAALNGTGVGTIVAKPVAGPALIEALIAGAQENHRRSGDGKLESQAA
ncbi:ATP-binding protein [Sphingomonas sp. MG17]|uniref:histidine kinase n=1 Tax=Sphingomonas tagetis TaxID=2949092 RepID=A0A9X2KJR0_9SPHN|nr:ATP-binding protein [Sphingomonas tagetis]MCP3728935.1 ATP-binding protein [Sphingomonas tagetis]